MLRFTSPLSAWRVALHRRAAVSAERRPASLHPVVSKLHHAARSWLLMALMAIALLGAAVLLVLQLFVGHIPFSAWLVVLLLLGLVVFVYIITLIAGHWDVRTQRMQLDPMISLLVMALFLLIIVAWVRTTFLGEQTWWPYLDALGVAIALLLATTLIAFIERR